MNEQKLESERHHEAGSELLRPLGPVEGCTRAEFLFKVAVGGAALLASLGTPKSAAARRSNDVEILRFDLTFEYLQAHFYTEGLAVGGLTNETRDWARVVGAHERAHVRILRSVLGKASVKRPFLDYHGVTEDEEAFTRTAVAMEDLTTALLTGQIPHLSSPELVSAAFSLLTVEARHAAWVRHRRGLVPTAAAFDRPRSISEVNRLVASTHFMRSDPKTYAKVRPRFTG